jgi:molecular chaperone HscB
MNYFELFELPLSLQPDKAAVRRQYLLLSRKYHPDHHAQFSPEAQQEALEASAQLNKALKTLSSPDETIRYVLSLKGILNEEEKYSLPPDFLMEMMDINEALSELQPGDEGIANMESQLSALESDIYAPVAPLIKTYTDGPDPDGTLLAVKDYYFKKKYLDRLRQQLAGML